MDFDLNEYEKMIQNLVRDFASKEVRPQAAEIDRTGEFPTQIVRKMGDVGLFGVPWPKEWGGAEAGYLPWIMIVEELSRASMVVGLIFSVCVGGPEAIYRYGSEQHKQKYLHSLVTGEEIWGWSFTEAATGSDPGAITTKAVLDGDYCVITGEKNFTSLMPILDKVIIFAKYETGRVSAIIVPTDSPGFTFGKQYETLGHRGSATGVITLDGVRVPKANVLGEKSQGYSVLLEMEALGKTAMAAIVLGGGQTALELSIDYAKGRIVYGKPMAELMSTQWLLAEIASRLEALRWVTYRTAELYTKGVSIVKEGAMCKLLAAQMGEEIASMAMQVHGAYGWTKDLEIERFYRDVKLTGIAEGSSELGRTLIAHRLLKYK